MENMTVKNSTVFYSFKSKIAKQLSLLLILSALTACGGGGNDSENNLTQSINVSAIAGNMQVTLSWNNVIDATAYDICSATETITQPANCSAHQNGALAVDQTSPAIISSLTNDTEYFFVVIPQNANGDGAVSAVVSAIPTPTPIGKLNDTGITRCADYAFGLSEHHDNDLDCNLTADDEDDPILPGQDAVSGRDAGLVTNNDNDGHKGFSFSKIGSNGLALTDQSSATFSCVKDNVTGLIWEVKRTAVGLHNKDDVYTWLNTLTPANNGGDNGTVNADASCENHVDDHTCNTQAYVSRVNFASLCGATNWRLPTRKELRSLVIYDRTNPAIDTEYFPNTISNAYWSSSPHAASNIAWGVSSAIGSDFAGLKSGGQPVRLVRSGQ